MRFHKALLTNCVPFDISHLWGEGAGAFSDLWEIGKCYKVQGVSSKFAQRKWVLKNRHLPGQPFGT